jgi:chemotaxis protein histidine kinase CheA
MVMAVDPFIERLGRVRERFVSALEGKIEDTYSALSDLSEETYRRIHGIVGIGPTVGFAATGRAARALETILLRPHEEERALTTQEIASFKEALHALRETAAQELQSFHSGQR